MTPNDLVFLQATCINRISAVGRMVSCGPRSRSAFDGHVCVFPFSHCRPASGIPCSFYPIEFLRVRGDVDDRVYIPICGYVSSDNTDIYLRHSL